MPSPSPDQLAMLIGILNIIAFSSFGLDKLLAKTGKRRISEKALLTASALFASPGALLGMIIFNHKTSKSKFRYGVPIILGCHLAYWLAYQ